jgi:hypothetical protein
MMKNHLTQLPFLARATQGRPVRASTAGKNPGRTPGRPGSGACAASAAERLYRLAARLRQTGNFQPFKRPLVTDA